MTQQNPGRRSDESDFESEPFRRTPFESGRGDAERKAKRTARNVSRQAKRGVDDIKNQATSALHNQKETAAQKVEELSSVIRQAAQSLHDKNAPGFAGFVDQAADSFDRLSESIREGDFRDMINATQDWARRHPAIFLGGSLLAGMLLARFLKSSAENNDSEYEDFERDINRTGDQDEYDREYSQRRRPSTMSQYGRGSQAPAGPTPGMTIPTPGGQAGQPPDAATSWEET